MIAASVATVPEEAVATPYPRLEMFFEKGVTDIKKWGLIVLKNTASSGVVLASRMSQREVGDIVSTWCSAVVDPMGDGGFLVAPTDMIVELRNTSRDQS